MMARHDEIVALGKKIDGELCRHGVDVRRVQALAARRREIIAQMESEYIELWARGNRVLTMAFRAVPRHLFLPGIDLERVYSGAAIPTQARRDGVSTSSSSEPALMRA